MEFDFTTIMERKGRDAIAVDCVGQMDGFAPAGPKEGFDVLPMWVADMNFPTAPSICEAIRERLEHPAFGYFRPREEYFAAICRWQEKRHGVQGLKPEHIGYENGVLGGVVSAANVLCSRGDKIWCTAPWCRMKRVYIAWILRIWRRKSAPNRSMRRCSARPTIPADGFGSAGNWNRSWHCLKSIR